MQLPARFAMRSGSVSDATPFGDRTQSAARFSGRALRCCSLIADLILCNSKLSIEPLSVFLVAQDLQASCAIAQRSVCS
jgi:hypothetical protein